MEKNRCMFQFSKQGFADFGSMTCISVNDAAYVAFHNCLEVNAK